MDDIDEMSMGEGSRKSQQDFHYNATGSMNMNRVVKQSLKGKTAKDFGQTSQNMTLISNHSKG